MSRSLEEGAAAPRSEAEWLAYGRDVLARQPFSQLLGAELAAFSPSRCELRLPVTPQLLQQHGFVHGGVVSYLADNALTYAGGAALQGPVVTSELKINYLRPARGEWLIARAETLHCGRTQAVCRCEVYAIAGGVEKLCAAAQGTIALLPDAAGADAFAHPGAGGGVPAA